MAWYILGTFSWISDGHPYPFYPGSTPPPPTPTLPPSGFENHNFITLSILASHIKYYGPATDINKIMFVIFLNTIWTKDENLYGNTKACLNK